VHWEDRAAAIVIDPELENWFWADSPHIADPIRTEERERPSPPMAGNGGFLAQKQGKAN
jgi:hypothetical protein